MQDIKTQFKTKCIHIKRQDHSLADLIHEEDHSFDVVAQYRFAVKKIWIRYSLV